MKKITVLLWVFLIPLIYTAEADERRALDDMSIVIPSYDKYSELWHPTFEMLFRNWPNILTKYKYVPIYLISNFEKYEHPRITNILVGDLEKGWSDNFLKALRQIKSKYVLIILDDYIVTSPVNDKKLIAILNLMNRTDAAYAEIALDNVPNNEGVHIDGVSGVITKARYGGYRTSLQTCIWETKVLKSLLRPEESIWDFEKNATLRIYGSKKPFYLITEDPVFVYLNAAHLGHYQKSVIDYINKQNIPFAPTKLPIESCGLFCTISEFFRNLY